MRIKNSLMYYATLPFPIQILSSTNYFIYIVIMIYYAYLSLPNPLIDSNNAVFHGSYVHPISWVFVLIFALYARYKIPLLSDRDKVARITLSLSSGLKPSFKEKVQRKAYKNIIYFQWLYNALLSFLLVAFAMAITELAWDISITYYWYVHNEMIGITIYNFVLTYAYFLTGAGIIATIMTRSYRRFRYVWLIPIVFGIYHIIWLSYGFPISTFVGHRFDLTANIFELGHWGLVPSMFGVLLK